MNLRSLVPLWGLLAAGLTACATRAPMESEEARARYEFKRIVRAYEIPAAETTNAADRAAYQEQALLAYEALRAAYPNARATAAAALRAVGHLHAARGERKEALAAFARVGVLYPEQEWEVIQAWRAAGDLLWTAGMKKEALPFYQDIVTTFDRPDLPPLFDTIVRIARDRIANAK